MKWLVRLVLCAITVSAVAQDDAWAIRLLAGGDLRLADVVFDSGYHRPDTSVQNFGSWGGRFQMMSYSIQANTGLITDISNRDSILDSGRRTGRLAFFTWVDGRSALVAPHQWGNTTGDFTYVCWYKKRAGRMGHMAGVSDAATVAGSQWLVAHGDYNWGFDRLGFAVFGGSTRYDLAVPVAQSPLNYWNHAAFVHRGASMEIWTNGVMATSRVSVAALHAVAGRSAVFAGANSTNRLDLGADEIYYRDVRWRPSAASGDELRQLYFDTVAEYRMNAP